MRLTWIKEERAFRDNSLPRPDVTDPVTPGSVLPRMGKLRAHGPFCRIDGEWRLTEGRDGQERSQSPAEAAVTPAGR